MEDQEEGSCLAALRRAPAAALRRRPSAAAAGVPASATGSAACLSSRRCRARSALHLHPESEGYDTVHMTPCDDAGSAAKEGDVS